MTDLLRVEHPRYNLNAPQVWYDSWRNTDRVLRYRGRCVVCRTRTYGFDDGENDPRGVLGDRATSAYVAADHEMEGPDVPACFYCQNDEPRYRRGLDLAKRHWRQP